jgi:hypothetical protein
VCIALLDLRKAETVEHNILFINDQVINLEINYVLKMIMEKILRPGRLIFPSWTMIEMELGERDSLFSPKFLMTNQSRAQYVHNRQL